MIILSIPTLFFKKRGSMNQDDVLFGVFTMILGAIIGSVLSPVGEVLGSWIAMKLKGTPWPKNFSTPILFLLAGNALWVVGEILLEIFIRPNSKIEWSTVAIISIIFALCAIIFFVGYRYVPNDKKETPDSRLVIPLRLFMLASVFWLIAELSETILSRAFEPFIFLGLITHPAVLIRGAISLIVLMLLIKAIRETYKIIK